MEAKKEQVEKKAQAKQKRNKSDKNKMRNFANFATFARANLGKRHSDIATRKNYCSTKTNKTLLTLSIILIAENGKRVSKR